MLEGLQNFLVDLFGCFVRIITCDYQILCVFPTVILGHQSFTYLISDSHFLKNPTILQQQLNFFQKKTLLFHHLYLDYHCITCGYPAKEWHDYLNITLIQ